MIKIGFISNLLNAFSGARWGKIYGVSTRSAPYSGAAYEHEVVRAIIDCIATHTAKAEAVHVVVDENDRVKEIKRDSPYVKLLNAKANPIMSGFDLKYKLVSQLEDRNTAVAYVKWNGVIPEYILPIPYTAFEFKEIEGGGRAIEFNLDDGSHVALGIESVVILRKHYNKGEIAGDSNKPIYNTLDMLKASDDGLKEALQVSNKIRGMVKQKKAMLSPEDVQKSQTEFQTRYSQAAKEGGIIGLDSMEDYTPINATQVYSANAAQTREILKRLYFYWRVSESILMSDYNETQWKAFFESVIEPILIAMGQAFTNVCFTEKEYAEGNRIQFSSSVLMSASTQTKTNLITATKEIGMFTLNEYRGLFGYAPIVDGDERVFSLNFIKAKDASKYQLGEEDDGEKTTTTEGDGEV